MSRTSMTASLVALAIALLLCSPAWCEGDGAKAAESATHFSFVKTGSLIRRPAGMSKPGPFFPMLEDMRQLEGFPYEYALYISTDHDRAGGGMWLYVCNGRGTS